MTVRPFGDAYPRAVSTDREPRRYLFPLARLRQPDRGDHSPERDGHSAEGDNAAPSGAVPLPVSRLGSVGALTAPWASRKTATGCNRPSTPSETGAGSGR
jgi:hypothetical protein